MQYQNEIVDPDGYTHSIDMVLIDYWLHIGYRKFADKVIELFGGILGFDADKQSSLDNYPSFKYQYYVDMIWFDGITIYLGKYSNYDKGSKTWDKLDCLRIKVNPNKHLGSPALDKLLGLICEYASDGQLVRYDYAVDVPCKIDDVLVVGSRKEHGLYKGTRYYGQRHKHGYCKIYDKSKEQGLDTVMTRIEYTYTAGLPLSWDNIVIRAPIVAPNAPVCLSKTLRLYLDMLIEIKALGGQIEPYIERMDYKTYKKIEPFLFAGKQLQVDQSILDSLVNKINDIFIIVQVEQKVNNSMVDADGFIADFETDLPFD